MRSRPDHRLHRWAALALLAACLWGARAVAWGQVSAGVAEAPASAAVAASAVPLDAIERTISQLRDEGHFGRKHPERYLRFKPDKKDADKPRDKGPSWWSEFLLWLSQVGRVGVWSLGALAVAMLVVLALRLRRQAATDAAIALPHAAPGRVREYDIRPQSLPADIGAAVWAQWQAGERRPAMVLLYRGALSHLVHRHAVPIRAGCTEGDCLALARQHLSAERSDYFARVTHARLLATYAERWPGTDEVRALCGLFDPRLARVPAPGEAAA